MCYPKGPDNSRALKTGGSEISKGPKGSPEEVPDPPTEVPRSYKYMRFVLLFPAEDPWGVGPNVPKGYEFLPMNETGKGCLRPFGASGVNDTNPASHHYILYYHNNNS